MAHVSLRGITKRFADGVPPAVDNVSLDIPSGGFLTLLGPSGCGKSSTLRMLAGLSFPDEGQILIDGKDVTRAGPQDRHIGMVFQNHALFPHMDVLTNVAFGLQMRGVDKSDQRLRSLEALKMVELDHVADRYPHQLSGGQQQRVALARALVVKPSVLILDEPFSALDRKLRETMQVELYRITRELRTTALFVTHDQEEALTLSDNIAVMNKGRVEQYDEPRNIYSAPNSRFVAQFMGMTNFLPAQRAEQGLSVEGVRFLGVAVPDGAGDLELALRPEGLRMWSACPVDRDSLQGTLVQAIYQGAVTTATVRLASGRELLIRSSHGDAPVAVGEATWVTWQGDALRVFA
jgi:putative spermidine/putrescine transport system ATP-binding protein/spermidine/putrescine transport system ATP-binding protein